MLDAKWNPNAHANISRRFSVLCFSLPMSTKEETKEEAKVEAKKAGDDAPPVNIGWDSHQAVVRS